MSSVEGIDKIKTVSRKLSIGHFGPALKILIAVVTSRKEGDSKDVERSGQAPNTIGKLQLILFQSN